MGGRGGVGFSLVPEGNNFGVFFMEPAGLIPIVMPSEFCAFVICLEWVFSGPAAPAPAENTSPMAIIKLAVSPVTLLGTLLIFVFFTLAPLWKTRDKSCQYILIIIMILSYSVAMSLTTGTSSNNTSLHHHW
jgi:hypothetical protein